MPRPPTPTVSLVEVMSLPKTTVSPRRLAVISETGRNSGASQAERHALLLSDYTADILCDASKQIEATVGDIATLAQSVRLLFIPVVKANHRVAVRENQAFHSVSESHLLLTAREDALSLAVFSNLLLYQSVPLNVVVL